MTNISLEKNSDGILGLSFDNWFRIFSNERTVCDEKVVAIGKLGNNNTLTLTNMQWTSGFKDLPGLMMVPSSLNELEPGGDQGRVICLADDIVTYLEVCVKGSLSSVCFGLRGGINENHRSGNL